MKLITLLLTASVGAAAYAAPFSDQPRSYAFTDNSGNAATAHFPWIAGGPPGVAERMNVYLHDRLAKTLPAADPRQVKINFGEGMVSLDSQGIQMLNGGRTVRVQVSAEGCGAYCSESSEAIDFDAETGRLVSAPDMLLPDTYAKLTPLASKNRRASIRSFKVKLQKEVAKQKKSEQERTREQIDLYENCLAHEDPGGWLVVADSQFSYVSPDCSDHASRALDDLGDFSYVVKGEGMRPYLTPYGRRLLLGEGDGAVPAVNLSGQLFKGTIGNNLPVTLYLGAGTLGGPYQEARYYYDKYRQRIALRVEHSGGHFTLTEYLDGKPGAVMSLNLSGAKLGGEWRSGAKRLPVELTAY